jgi:AAA domain/Primase C terminal 2 (PriCT-2)
MSNQIVATPTHDKDMARTFLAGLDPNATKFTFQFFSDRGDRRHAEIFHGTLDKVWSKVQLLNTPESGVGVFVTISETDFNGRKNENIVRPRALFADADNEEQVKSCFQALKASCVTPSMIVNSGRGHHFYFCADDIPRDQFSARQEGIANKLGTDAAVRDLPRVMRLPGTLHLKNPASPKLVELQKRAVTRWKLSELIAKLGLSPANTAASRSQTSTGYAALRNNGAPDWAYTTKPAAAFAHLDPMEGQAAGSETNIEEIRSATMAIPASVLSTEEEWMKFARGLAHEAARIPHHSEQLWDILNTISSAAPNYDENDNRERWLRYINEASSHPTPITISTIFHMARQHGWPGWSPPLAAAAVSTPATPIWSADELKISFDNIPHRRWLYGTNLIRGEVTVLAAPGGAGKTALATGMAVEIATGIELLGETIYKEHDLNVLFINGEDNTAEIKRRIWAFCLAYAHIMGGQSYDRLLVVGADNPKVHTLSFLKTEKTTSTLDPSGFEALQAALDTLHPDVVVLDPLVAFCGGGNMNDNSAMAQVVRRLKGLANEYDCAMLVVHHTKKGGGSGDAEAILGAAAIVNLARRWKNPPLILPGTQNLQLSTSCRPITPSIGLTTDKRLRRGCGAQDS